MAYGFKDYLNVDYTQTGDGQLALNAKKRKRADQEHEAVEPTDEALTMAQRRAKSRQMKKYQARLKVGRSKARMRVASSKVLAKRARKQARNMIAKKLTKGISKADLTPARKQEIEKRLDKMAPRVTRLAKKITPKLRQAELGKKRG
tara:strand:- start:4003 stop:4443 length:441 start_codon:yes stop_codon:yes gene_type:complete